MDAIKKLATQRGIKTLSFAGVDLPIEMALENDQFAPILVLSALEKYAGSGLNYGDKPFPWGVTQEGNNGFIAGNTVVDQDASIPRAIGYLFIDHQIESVVAHNLALGHSTEHISLDYLIDHLEARLNEPNNSLTSQFNPS